MRALLLIFLTGLGLTLNAQIYNPVKWSVSLKPAANGIYTLVAKATIDSGWWVYSQYLESEEGPIATTVNYDEGTHFKVIGKNTESDNAKKAFDKLFEMNVIKFSSYYTIEQKIKVTDPSKPITGYINYMTCNDERCLPPVDHEFSLLATAGSTGDATTQKPSVSPVIEKPTDGKQEKTTGSSEITVEKKKVTETASTTEDHPSSGSFSNTSNFNNTTTGTGSGVLKPVKWTFRSEKKGEGRYDVIAEAVIEDGWHTYSGTIQQEDGPVPTSYVITPTQDASLDGIVLEHSSSRMEGYDKYFDMNLIKFKHDLKLIQTVKTSTPGLIGGTLEFMVCNNTRCLAPEYIEFTIDLATGQQVLDDAMAGGPKILEGNLIDQTIPEIKTSYTTPVSDCGDAPEEKKGNLLWMFIFGMINGFVALLTPCVFPMIPLTVSFFTKDSKRKGWQNGLVYGASIIVIYVVLGLLITILFGAGSLNELSTNPVANTIFFLIFIFFAFSFFGFYEITLPSSWSNKSDALADKGGLIGIFFMAATLAIVSFSCTGPLIGTALVEASSEGFLGPMIVMAGFSIALAIPFSLFAAFPAWLNSLPKSGGWMNSVKVILGFAELALALKFLSVADMTAHWGILKYELFMGLWVIIALGMAAYMFGLIRFPHDTPNRKLTPIMATMGLGFTALSLYLATGLFGSEKTGSYNALGLMSGLAPPAHYNFFKPLAEVDPGLAGSKYASLGKCANNFNCFHDYYEGLAYAREVNKPILLDFTGYGCVNCRKTEEHIWSRETIRKRIDEEFVLISLYVDDKQPQDTVLISAITNEKIRTVGRMWTDFQVVNFNQNSQPLYVIMSPDQQVLTAPRGYDPDYKGYEAFLECGLNTFKELSAPAIGISE